MLMSPTWTEWHESKVELQELPQCEPVFHNFLEYFYTGKIMITHTNVMAVLALADKYIVKVKNLHLIYLFRAIIIYHTLLQSLIRLCVDYMSCHIPHAAAHNVLFSWLQYTEPCGHTDVSEKCKNYIKWNLESVANNSEFSQLEGDLLISILKQNDLVVYNEMVLYNCIVRWLELQKIKLQQSGLLQLDVDSKMDKLVETAMSYIRFPMMTPRELADLLLSPLTKKYKEFFVDRMAIGMTFHAGQEDRIRLICGTEEGRLLFTPRLYTSDSFSALLTIDNITSLPSYHTSTFVFSSHISAAECESDKVNEWVVDIYPKGVWFKKCFLIVWQGMLEIPEEIISTIRLSLTCRDLREDQLKVKIALLLYGRQGDKDHIKNVIEVMHYFTKQSKVLNINDIIPFHELNPQAVGGDEACSHYLVGTNRNQLKINIVITPLPPSFTGDFGNKTDNNCSLIN